MSLADSKAAFILANGNPITIIRSTGNVTTTGRIMAMKRRTGFFSINYLREALFVPTSGVQRGDLIRDETTGEQFFVEGFQTKTRDGIVSSLNAELYMVNYPAVQIQQEQTTYDLSGNITGMCWITISTVPANVEHVKGDTSYKEGLLLADTTFLLTVQTAVEIKLTPTPDRIIIDGHSYQVSDINLSIIPGLQVVQVKPDTRG